MPRVNSFFRSIGTLISGDNTDRAANKRTPASQHPSPNPLSTSSENRNPAQAKNGRLKFLSLHKRKSPNISGLPPASATYVKQAAPELYQQIQNLTKSGWEFEERPHLNRGDYSGHKRIVIDPRIATGDPGQLVNKYKAGYASIKVPNPHAYLYALAHQVGCAKDQEPISLRNKDEYVQSNLRREASGVWNELQIRRSILQRSGGKDIWEGRDSEFKALIAIHDKFLKGENEADAKQQIADALKEMHLADGSSPSKKSKTTYTQAFAKQYEAFQISASTRTEVIDHVQACFNETNVALPADKIKACGHKAGGPFHWISHETFSQIIREQKTGFQAKGITEDEIGPSIMSALTTGTKWNGLPDAEWHYYTYYDQNKNSVLGLFVKPGEKPGQITEARMQDWPGVRFIQDSHGKYHSINLNHNTLLQQRASGFHSHGIADADIGNAILTAVVAGNKQPPQPSDGDWATYKFRFKESPAELTLRVKQDPTTGEIHDYEMPLENATSPLAGNFRGIDQILAGSEGSGLNALAKQLNISAEELLGTVIQPDNIKRSSLENPGFGIYRATMNGRSPTILARTQNGQIMEVKPPTALDQLFLHFPELEKRYAKLQQEGWEIRRGAPGCGGFCNRSQKQIVLDPTTILADPFVAIETLGHEMGHATYQLGKYDSKESYIQENAMDEGNAMFSEYKLLDEVSDINTKNQLLNVLNAASYGVQGMALYNKWKADRANASSPQQIEQADKAAQSAYSEIFKNLPPSTCPEGVTYGKMWGTWYNRYVSDNRCAKLMERLAQQTPPVKVWETNGKWDSPSFNNIQSIYHFPKQANSNQPKTIFISKATFYREVKQGDPEHLATIIENAINYGTIDVQENPNSSKQAGIQTAICSYNKYGKRHSVQMNFDADGSVFDLKVTSQDIVQPPASLNNNPNVAASASAPASTAVDWSGYDESGLVKHREFIEDIKARLS